MCISAHISNFILHSSSLWTDSHFTVYFYSKLYCKWLQGLFCLRPLCCNIKTKTFTGFVMWSGPKTITNAILKIFGIMLSLGTNKKDNGYYTSHVALLSETNKCKLTQRNHDVWTELPETHNSHHNRFNRDYFFGRKFQFQ